MKWPRTYAFEIAAMRTIEERRAALEQVPQRWRAMVEDHLETIFFKRRCWRRLREAKAKAENEET